MNVRDQTEAARRATLAVPLVDRAVMVVTGHDRLSWLNGMVTCDLVKRPGGEARYGLFVARAGRVLADACVVEDDTRILAAVPSSGALALREHLEHYLVMEDAEIDPRMDGFEPWALHGPRSGDVLAAARRAGAVGGSLDRTGLGGAIMLLPAEHRAEARDAVTRAVSDAGGVVGDAVGWNVLRLERAIPEFGVDFDATTYPQEAGLEKVAVSFDKGCYLGQEVVCMLEMRGHVKRRLAPLVIDHGEVPPGGTVVTDGAGAPVGEITSSARSPALGKSVALAMLKRASAEAQGGADLLVAGAHARVVAPPL